MRKVSMKRKSGRKSATNIEKQNGVAENYDENEGSVSGEEEIEEPRTSRGPAEKKRRKHGRKSASVSPKKSVEAESEEENQDQEDAEQQEEEENDVQYEVEKVLDEKVTKGVKHYLIRWKGYDADSDTWEPESTLNCADLIKEFRAKRKSKKGDKDEDSPRKSKGREIKIKIKNINWKENEEFEVDRILEVHHRRDGKREFLVSWKGYPTSDNSWEPEENMTCPEMIVKFMEKVEKAKTSDARELRENRMHTNRFTLSAQSSGRRLSKRNQGKQRVQYHDAE